MHISIEHLNNLCLNKRMVFEGGKVDRRITRHHISNTVQRPQSCQEHSYASDIITFLRERYMTDPDAVYYFNLERCLFTTMLCDSTADSTAILDETVTYEFILTYTFKKYSRAYLPSNVPDMNIRNDILSRDVVTVYKYHIEHSNTDTNKDYTLFVNCMGLEHAKDTIKFLRETSGKLRKGTNEVDFFRLVESKTETKILSV